MNVFSFDVRQMLQKAESGTLKPGDAVSLRVIRNLENGLYLMSLRGATVQAKLPDGVPPGTYNATVTPDGKSLEVDLANPKSLTRSGDAADDAAPASKQPLPEKALLQTPQKSTPNTQTQQAQQPQQAAGRAPAQVDAAVLGLKAGASVTLEVVSTSPESAKVIINNQTVTVRLAATVPPGQYAATVTATDGDTVELMLQPRDASRPPVLVNVPKTAFPQNQAPAPGQTVTVSVEQADDAAGTVRVKVGNAELTLPARPSVATGQVLAASTTKTGDIPTLVATRLIADTTAGEHTARIITGTAQLPLPQGQQVPVQVMRPVESNIFLISVKGRLMQATFEEFPSLGKYTATVSKKAGETVLTMPRKPEQPVNPGMLKSQLGELNMAKIKDAVTRLGSIKLDDFSPESIKKVVRDGGLHFEHKLLSGSDQGSDGKMQAYQQGDAAAREGITRLQIANFVLAGDLFTFFTGPDETARDGTLRISRDASGSHVVYIKMEFSNLGPTITTIRPVGQSGYDILVKTEEDISDRLAAIELENARVHWARLAPEDEKPFDIRGEVIGKLGNFEVIV